MSERDPNLEGIAGDVEMAAFGIALLDPRPRGRLVAIEVVEPERRHLLRLWLAASDARPLPAVFAQRYGSVTVGDRGGIIVRGTRLHAPLAAI